MELSVSEKPHTALSFAERSTPDSAGLLATAFYIAANGQWLHAARLLPVCRELASGGEESS